MADFDPRQYLDLLKRGPGGRSTYFSGPPGVVQAQGDWLGRTGTPGWRERSRPYPALPDPDLQQRLQDVTGSALGNLQELAPPRIQAGQLPPPVVDTRRPPLMGQGIGATAPEAAGGPQGFVSKIGSFFGRPGVGAQLAALGEGIATESSRPGGSAWTGFAKGSAAAVRGEQQRQVLAREEQEAARIRAIEDEERAAQKKVNDKIQEIEAAWDVNTTPAQMASDLRGAAMAAFGIGNGPLARGLLEQARDIIPDPDAVPAVRYKTWDQTEGRAPDGKTPTRVREVTAGTPGTISDRQWFDKDLYLAQIGEGVDAAKAAQGSWRTGGIIVDPDETKAAADKEVTQSTQEKLNARLGDAAYDGLMLMVVDPATVDPETGEITPGQPNYADYYMAGAVPIRNPQTGAITDWEQGSPGKKEAWQSFLASLISNAGSETAGFGMKLLGFFGRSVFLRDNPEILKAYTNALNYINPTVRFLSGAQMTNQEAMRYYNALIPAPGDHPEVIELKRRKRDVLTNAMGGPGVSDAARQRAREVLGVDEDELMVHEYGAFGGDASGRDAADYYLARLTRAVGATDMTDYGAVSGQVDDTLYDTDNNDPGVYTGGN